MRKWLRLWALAGLLGCTNSQPAGQRERARSDMAESRLVTALEVRVAADSVRLVFHVTNSGTEPEVLEFNSAARYDFEVRTRGGAEVWRWSKDQMFAQVLGADTIAAGDSRRYSEAWLPGDRTGAFVAIAQLLASNQVVEQRTEFELQPR